MASFCTRRKHYAFLFPLLGDLTIDRRPRSLWLLFMKAFQETLAHVRPRLVLTYGGHGVGESILRECRAQGIKTVVLLHNLAYNSGSYFNNVDLVCAPSQFAAKHYRLKLSITPSVVPPLIDLASVDEESFSKSESEREYVLFFNPRSGRGLDISSA